MTAILRAIECAFPEDVLSTEKLSQEYPAWEVEKIDRNTGIRERRIAAPDQCASDLAVAAAEKLFASGVCRREEIDFLLFCTQTPDYFLPPTACLLQHRLGLPRNMGSFDFNLGSSGYIYGLGLAQALIDTGQASNVLFLTADTYSKLLHPRDRSVRTIFGDGATATWIPREGPGGSIQGPYVYGTDGEGGPNLIVAAGAFRTPHSAETSVETTDESGNIRSADHLYMSGMEIFAFTMRVVPRLVRDIMEKAALGWDDIDLVIFHQANRQMLEHLRRSIRIPEAKFHICVEQHGNTVSCTIPIALDDAMRKGRIRDGSRVMLAGFGVGYSWGATILRWQAA